MSRLGRPPRAALSAGLLAAALSLTIILSGCDSGPAEFRPSTTVDTGSSMSEEPRGTEVRQAREFFARVAACMSDQGIPAEVAADDAGIEYESVPGTDQHSEEIYEACAAEMGGEPTAAPLSEAEIGLVYEELLKVRECLLAEGYEASDPPSRETFIAQYTSAASTETGPWTPYPMQGRIVNVTALQDCPTKNIFDQ